MSNNDFIYDWNIDGLSEHEILNVLRQIEMASTAYLTDGDDHNVVQLILAGLFGTLKCWWDNCLNDNERIFIQTSMNDEAEQKFEKYFGMAALLYQSLLLPVIWPCKGYWFLA